jgi:aldehyde dehydrogenase (NAD+)
VALAAATEIASVDPADPGRELGRVRAAGGIDVDAAITRARRAASGWARKPATERAAALQRAAGRIEQRAVELADLVCAEVGKPIVEARGEVARTAAILRYHAGLALDADGESYPPADGRSLLLARRRPRGVVGLITPWNFPLAIPAWKLAPALALGNACVWKSSPFSPVSAEALAEALQPELDEGVLTLLHGGADTGAALVGHPGLAALSFTGSAAVGRSIAGELGGRGVPAQCEMGGQNASIVLADANLEAVAATIANAAMGYAGQKCTATSRVIVESAVAAQMRDALVAAVERLGVRDPADPACQVGPVISADAREKALAAVRRARDAGASVLTGGEADGDPGWYVRPALVALDDPGAELAQEEVFGPVCAVLEAADAGRAVEIANGVRYGLATSIFTRDLDRALELADRVDTGLVRVNQPTSGVDFHAPFGGEKASGLGPREQGKAARDFYTSLRTTLISPSLN